MRVTAGHKNTVSGLRLQICNGQIKVLVRLSDFHTGIRDSSILMVQPIGDLVWSRIISESGVRLHGACVQESIIVEPCNNRGLLIGVIRNLFL